MTAEYIETPWDSLIAGVDAGRYDIVLNNVAPTDERKKKYDFSVPYAHSPCPRGREEGLEPEERL